jgi:hypothetical protein
MTKSKASTERLNAEAPEPQAIPAQRDTREAWLHRATDLLRPKFEALGKPLPKVIHISVGLPKGRKAIGECWAGSASEDGARHVFISPVLDAIDALDTLVHELAHAALPEDAKHKRPFAQLAIALGLDGKPTSTSAGPALRAELSAMLDVLGEYPHAKLDPTRTGKPKQSTRLVKCECGICGYTVRTTSKWLNYAGPPLCPAEACEAQAMQCDVFDAGEAEGEE